MLVYLKRKKDHLFPDLLDIFPKIVSRYDFVQSISGLLNFQEKIRQKDDRF